MRAPYAVIVCLTIACLIQTALLIEDSFKIRKLKQQVNGLTIEYGDYPQPNTITNISGIDAITNGP